MLKAIPLSEAKKLFPEFQPKWKPHHPECEDPQDVALGDPRFGTARQMVIVETDMSGNPTKPRWDQFRLEEGPAYRDFPGTIVVPYCYIQPSQNELRLSVILRKENRPIRGTYAYEFPQGGVEGEETVIDTGRRELLEETGLHALDCEELQEICAEPDWFPRGTKVVAARVDFDEVATLRRAEKFQCFPISGFDLVTLASEMDSATSLAALMRFFAWRAQRELRNK